MSSAKPFINAVSGLGVMGANLRQHINDATPRRTVIDLCQGVAAVDVLHRAQVAISKAGGSRCKWCIQDTGHFNPRSHAFIDYLVYLLQGDCMFD